MKYFSLIIFVGLIALSKPVSGQKYIKYFFNDNSTNILVEKSLIKVNDENYLKELYSDTLPIMAFVKLNMKVKFAIYEFELKEDESFENVVQRLNLELLSFAKKEKYFNISKTIDRKEVWVFEYTDEKYYVMNFLTQHKDSGYMNFIFKAPLEEKKKWQKIANDMLLSLKQK